MYACGLASVVSTMSLPKSSVHPSRSAYFFAVVPMHILSRKKSPAICPVPKLISEEPSPFSFCTAWDVLEAFPI